MKRILTDAHERPAGSCANAATRSTSCRERLLDKEVIEAEELKAIMGPGAAEGSRRRAGRDPAGWVNVEHPNFV